MHVQLTAGSKLTLSILFWVFLLMTGRSRLKAQASSTVSDHITYCSVSQLEITQVILHQVTVSECSNDLANKEHVLREPSLKTTRSVFSFWLCFKMLRWCGVKFLSEWRLAGLEVQYIFTCQSWPYSYPRTFWSYSSDDVSTSFSCQSSKRPRRLPSKPRHSTMFCTFSPANRHSRNSV